jgi:esterase/lipase/1-acyl-sn-glycerol-3-phosphate acyltransferase
MTRTAKNTRKTAKPHSLPHESLNQAAEILPGAVPAELPKDMHLDTKTFGRYMRLVELLGRRTGIKVHVSEAPDALREGDIFLFNHFTRFETVVAPYILFRETGQMARSVAYSGLFKVNDTMSKIIYQSGAVPNNLPRLLPFLAEEILRGRKVIIFPEGGLVKDKSVVDAQGNLKMWSGSAEKTRKPHRGAAVLALMLDLAKRKIRAQFEADDQIGLAEWCAKLDLSRDQLKAAVDKPTRIVPANITFYPMRTNPNLLVRSLERIMGTPAAYAKDELTIEGNLLLRPTDMDVRFGMPISALSGVKRLHTALLDHALGGVRDMDGVFSLKDGSKSLLDGYVSNFITKQVDRIREEYARRIYMGTTININHLVATLVRILTEQGRWDMPVQDFHNVLYVALKTLQQSDDMNLHHTLARPEHYGLLLEGKARGFIGFLEACTRARLIKKSKDVYKFSRRLQDVQDLQDIRLENPLQVHANEAAPIAMVRSTLEAVLARVEKISAREIATFRFDDMVREHGGQRTRFTKKAPHTLLGKDNMHTGRPYLLMPELIGKRPHKVGVVLVHGFATTPAELRTYGDHLRELGHVVLGVRLPGHGTSPLDLEARTRGDWVKAVRDAYDIMAGLTDEVAIVGFSTGGAVSLVLAQEHMPKLVRVASVAAPLLVHDKNIKWLPVGMVLRAVLKQIPGLSNKLRFYKYDSDDAVTVYPKVPVTALNELRLLMSDMEAGLPKVSVPTLVMQGLLDHTVQNRSAAMIFAKLGSKIKTLKWIAGGPHGLITHNFGPTWEILDAFVRGADVTGNAGAEGHKIQVAPQGDIARGKKNATMNVMIRKFA